jgi:histidine triad (HIT) family protein
MAKKAGAKKVAANKDAVLDALSAASQGLMFPSESEAPLEPFAWAGTDKLTTAQVVKLAGAEAGTAVEQGTLADLLRTVPREDQPQFQALKKVLAEQLSGVQVYKVGDEAEKQVYIVGKTSDGRWAGLKTTVVET